MSSSCSLSMLSTLFMASTNCLGPLVTAETFYLGRGDLCVGFVWAFLQESSLHHRKVGALHSRALKPPASEMETVIQCSCRRKCKPTLSSTCCGPCPSSPPPALSPASLRPSPGLCFIPPQLSICVRAQRGEHGGASREWGRAGRLLGWPGRHSSAPGHNPAVTRHPLLSCYKTTFSHP